MSKSGQQDKPFTIPKQLVWEAYRWVKANKGAAGVDHVSMGEFEKDLRGNLYKIWNRMSSGTYFPPPVKAVEIPKSHGGTRILGVPAVGGRIAQTVVALQLEARTESIFHPGSDLVVKAVEANTDRKWVLLYVKRWLKAPLQMPDGAFRERDRGTPQGSAVSRVLASLFLHYAMDSWLEREFPAVEFERYADDAVLHCSTEYQARKVRDALAVRLESLGLRLHPGKTKIVYCKDANRRGSYEHTSFTFLAYEFRPRSAENRKGQLFTTFSPAIGPDVLKAKGQQVREWRIHKRVGSELAELAAWINPVVRGWMNYYGQFNRSRLYRLLQRINTYIVRWARNKYRRLGSLKKAKRWWTGLVDREPGLFAHWAWISTF